jgi:hypothetical protein
MSQPSDRGPAFPGQDPVTGRERARELLADRRALALVGVAIVAVIALAVFVVVPALRGSSSGDSASGAVPRGTPAATATTSPAPSTSTKPANKPTPATSVRDPFVPLLAVPAGATAPAAGTSPAPGATGSPAPQATVTVTAPPVTGAGSGAGSVQIYHVTLISIGKSLPGQPHTAVVDINGRDYNAVEGKAVTPQLTFTHWSESVCTFSHGGQSFSLVPGEYAEFV